MKLGSVASLNPSVRIGSYPNVELSGEGLAYRVRACCITKNKMFLLPRPLTAALHSRPRPAHQSAPLCLAICFAARPLQVKLQFESRDPAALQRAVEAVEAQLETFSLP